VHVHCGGGFGGGGEHGDCIAGELGMESTSVLVGEEDDAGMYHTVSSLRSYLCPSTHICHDRSLLLQ